MAKREPGYVHQRSGSGNYYTSGPSKDPRAPGGRFISTGKGKDKTSRLYDSGGKLVDKTNKRDGGPSKNQRD